MVITLAGVISNDALQTETFKTKSIVGYIKDTFCILVIMQDSSRYETKRLS